jgi:hypothetical protein
LRAPTTACDNSIRIALARVKNRIGCRGPEHADFAHRRAGDCVQERRLASAGGSEEQHQQRRVDVRETRTDEAPEMVV